MEFKTVALFIHGAHFNQEKLMIFMQLANVAGCVRDVRVNLKVRELTEK